MRRLLTICAAVALAGAWAGAAHARYLLVQRQQPARMIELVDITGAGVSHRPGEKGSDPFSAPPTLAPLDQCIALIDTQARLSATRRAVVRLADGQRIPGEPVSAAASGDQALIWSHPLLGRLRLPLHRIESVQFTDDLSREGSRVSTSPDPGAATADAVHLTNGDRIEGLVVSMGDPLVIEIHADGLLRSVEIQFDRIASVQMITPRQPARGQRVWLVDGTVLEVGGILVGDDRIVRLTDCPLLGPERVERLPLFNLAAVQFAPGEMAALADMTPARVEGPATRYVIPPPQSTGAARPLGLNDVEIRGPVTVRYSLPHEASRSRFLADVTLPSGARQWGDCELIVLDDDREVFRFSFNHRTPEAAIDVPLTGSQLTIRLEEGANGPIQDRLIFSRAMLLMESR